MQIIQQKQMYCLDTASNERNLRKSIVHAVPVTPVAALLLIGLGLGMQL